MINGDGGNLSQRRTSLYTIEYSNGGLITCPRGIPSKDPQVQIIDVIGVSESLVENDHMVASAGASAL
nr:hypothetical protein [Gelidibacter sediminis]